MLYGSTAVDAFRAVLNGLKKELKRVGQIWIEESLQLPIYAVESMSAFVVFVDVPVPEEYSAPVARCFWKQPFVVENVDVIGMLSEVQSKRYGDSIHIRYLKSSTYRVRNSNPNSR